MVRRTRDIQKKIWLTPQEERTIAKKMEMIGTENFGAYARKMLIDGYIIVVDYTEQFRNGYFSRVGIFWTENSV